MGEGRHFVDGGGFSGYVEKDKSKKKLEIDVEVDLPKDVILKLALMAHEEDITLNDLCIRILKKYLDGDCPHDVIEGNYDDAHCVECNKKVEIE